MVPLPGSKTYVVVKFVTSLVFCIGSKYLFVNLDMGAFTLMDSLIEGLTNFGITCGVE